MKILFFAGPALGHISRLLTVATFLKENINNIDIFFAVPDVKNSADMVIKSGFDLTLIESATEERRLNNFP